MLCILHKNIINMKKQTVERPTTKVRISGSMHQWVIDWVNEEAKKEDRSFSDMNERLVVEAVKYRRGIERKLPTIK